MQKTLELVLPLCLLALQAVPAAAADADKTRAKKADETYQRLFRAERQEDPSDPELMEILQEFIFGEVFYIGDLDDKTRELITVTSLAAIQTLPQLKAHINAALNVGNDPVAVREAIYLCAPFIGFPRTLNAVAVFNEVAKARDIKLPLKKQGTVTDKNRYEKGLAVQAPLYGDEVKAAMASLPAPYNEKVPYILTSFGFGDFYTREGLSLQQKELLVLVVLAASGDEKQLSAHIVGNLKAGNSKETLLAAMVQAMPYIGMPPALTAINLIKSTDAENYRPIYEN